jgi:hypothetical protein
MPAFRDLTNQVFGNLVAIRCVGIRNRRAIWLCRCVSNGKELEVRGSSIVTGNTAGKHDSGQHNGRGFTSLLAYRSFNSMLQRTTNPNCHRWLHYGGAPVPVQVCEGLREFTGFLSVLGERPKGTSLGRFSDLGDYSCGQCEQCRQNGWDLNCSWQTPKQQGAEQRIKRQLKFIAEAA